MTNPYAPDDGEAAYGSLDVAELEARVDAGEKATADAFEQLGAEIVELKTLVSQLLEQEKAKHARRWATYASVDEWNELADWVDDLNERYSLNRQYAVKPCWPHHPGAVEELAALWSSWKKSTIAAETARRNGTNDYIAWHDRWLWPTLKRLRENHYDLTNCAPSQHNTPVASESRPSQRPWQERP